MVDLNSTPLLAREVLGLLTSLVEKNLVFHDPVSRRYSLSESVRHYGIERIAEVDLKEDLRLRHCIHFLSKAEEFESDLLGPEQGTSLRYLEGDHDNTRAAMDWALDSPGASTLALRFCGALKVLWEVRGHLHEGRARCNEALRRPGSSARTTYRGRALKTAGVLAYLQGDYSTAVPLLEESLSICRELGADGETAAVLNNLGIAALDKGETQNAISFLEQSLAIRRSLGDMRGVAATLSNLGNVANDQGDSHSARAFHGSSLAIFRDLGDRWGQAYSLNNLGLAALDSGDYEAARPCFEESLAIKRDLANRQGVARTLHNLGLTECAAGNPTAAKGHFTESLMIRRSLDDSQGITFSLEAFACLASKHDPARAAVLGGAATRLREDLKLPMPPGDRQRNEQSAFAARQALGAQRFQMEWEKGRRMVMNDAAEYALATGPENA